MAYRFNSNIDTSTPVVVFRSENYTSLGIVRTLGRMGVKVFCIDHEPNALAMKSRYCAGRFNWNVESSSPDDTIQFLTDVACKIGQMPILIPTFDTRNIFVDKYREQLSKWFLLPQPKPCALKQLYSKQGMYELCKSENLPTAKTIFPYSMEQVLNEGHKLGFPVVVKAIDGDRLKRRTGKRLAIVQEMPELKNVYIELDEPGLRNLLLQEFIPCDVEDAWVVSAYFDIKGNCQFALTGKKLRQLPIHGGLTTLGVCAPCEPVVMSICQIIKAVGYHGIIDADFIFDKRDGLWKLLDVNPRPGANFRLLVDKHGLDVVRALYLDLTGQSVPPIEPHWGRRWVVEDMDLAAFLNHSREGSLSIRTWLGSLRGVSEFAHISIGDLQPSISFLTKLISYYTNKFINRLLQPSKLNS